MKSIKFDDLEAELLYAMLIQHYKHNTWKVYEEEDWEELLRIKAIEKKLAKFINGDAGQ
jgi:hypothetical protein